MRITCRKVIFTLLILSFTVPSIHAGIAVLNGLTHEVKLSPGEKYRGRIDIQNSSAKETSVKLYQTDYWFSSSGESRYGEPGTGARSNAGWITLSQVFQTLQGNQNQTIDFEINVPAVDSLEGTYWSVIMVEGVAPPDTAASKKGVSISSVTRYAIQIITLVGDNSRIDLQFLNISLKKEEGGPVLEVDLGNPGNTAVRPETGLELFNQEGISQGIIKADRKRIYPGTSARFMLNLAGIKPGKYTGTLVADCDEDHIFGTNVTLEL